MEEASIPALSPDVCADTMHIALLVISAAGFGKSLPWSTKAEAKHVAAGRRERITYAECLKGIIDDFFVKLLTPDWAMRLPIPKLRTMTLHYKEFEACAYMSWTYCI